nr:NADH dehydrogenase subunit 1 [Propeamussium sp. mt1]
MCFSISLVLVVLLSVGFLTLFERKVIAFCQRRKGPEMVGFCGLGQPIADGLKLLSKEFFFPGCSNKFLYLFGPFVMLFHSLILWSCSPGVWGSGLFSAWSCLYILAVMSVGVYGMVMCGWSSNSKYSMLGAVRGLAQVISYEVMLVFIYLVPLFLGYSFNLVDVMSSSGLNFLVVFPFLAGWFFCVLAEAHRAPFDFIEGESELVSGFNVEYGGVGFTGIFIAEYSGIVFHSVLMSVLYFGGYLGSLLEVFLVTFMVSFFSLIGLFIIVLCRCAFPRYRYDLLMSLIWCTILPVLMGVYCCYLLVIGV